jgi:hypothetical protein
MVVGELGVGLAAAGLVIRTPKLWVPGVVIYAAGAPAIHVLHDDEPKAWGAVALHVGLPLVGAGIGALSASSLRRSRPLWAIYGVTLGAVAAPLVDGLLLGWKTKKPRDASASRARATPTFAAVPSEDGRGGGVMVGAAGVF